MKQSAAQAKAPRGTQSQNRSKPADQRKGMSLGQELVLCDPFEHGPPVKAADHLEPPFVRPKS